ncbi:MAG: hypothetical protein H6868_02115 [Rhodospirillales bacterium]|nr:hypothetical protein [Rhodospirillales bacterium]
MADNARISFDLVAARAFAQVCEAHPENPHLPKVFNHYAVDDGCYVTECEPLLSFEHLPEDQAGVLSGPVRAMTSLARMDRYPADRDHGDPHACLQQDEMFMAALGLLSDKAWQVTNEQDRLCLTFNCRNRHIRFRMDDKTGMLTPVFEQPFSTKTATETRRAMIGKQQQTFEPHKPADYFPSPRRAYG